MRLGIASGRVGVRAEQGASLLGEGSHSFIRICRALLQKPRDERIVGSPPVEDRSVGQALGNGPSNLGFVLEKANRSTEKGTRPAARPKEYSRSPERRPAAAAEEPDLQRTNRLRRRPSSSQIDVAELPHGLLPLQPLSSDFLEDPEQLALGRTGRESLVFHEDLLGPTWSQPPDIAHSGRPGHASAKETNE